VKTPKRKDRESRKGVAKIPLFGDFSVPLSFKVGKKEINGGSLFFTTILISLSDSETDIAELSRFLPFQIRKLM